MREIRLKTSGAYLLFIAGTLPIIFSSFFVFSNFRATVLDKKAKFLVKPYYVKSELVYYYQDKLDLISKAIQLSKGNAKYYTDKADYSQGIIKDDLARELFVNKKDVEELYKKAIGLNPANFLYHFDLGWFYTNEERFKEAEEELLKSYNLYPSEFQVQEHLVRYYLKRSKKELVEKGEWGIFKTLLQAIKFVKYKRWEFLGDIKEIIEELPSISWDEKEQQLIYAADLGSDKYDFKEKGFPHEKIPLIIRLYFKELAQEVVLYRGYVRADIFKKIKATPEFTIYEVKIKSFPQDTYLDDFRIETHPATIIDKIEIGKSFREEG